MGGLPHFLFRCPDLNPTDHRVRVEDGDADWELEISCPEGVAVFQMFSVISLILLAKRYQGFAIGGIGETKEPLRAVTLLCKNVTQTGSEDRFGFKK